MYYLPDLPALHSSYALVMLSVLDIPEKKDNKNYLKQYSIDRVWTLVIIMGLDRHLYSVMA